MNDQLSLNEPDFAAMGDRLMTAVSRARSKERTTRITAVGLSAGLGAVLLGGSFMVVLNNYQKSYVAECFVEASTASESVMSYMIPVEGDEQTPRSQLAADSCGASWRTGVIGQPAGAVLENKYPIPPMVVCEDQWGALKVFPTEDPAFCGTAGLRIPR
ncbi:hypothetical protein [Microbacterium sp. W4I20]|uniref:hypothetical protein n=1 Tax=Microbacterium sp. W4I20 TaxID=3042262 RepID=UPI0027826131|nr:hypothetical protein [Microbacterium sp. W4I20]MDQ0727129.1 hypothetical protein [Microbacterium sp. W4I20]